VHAEPQSRGTPRSGANRARGGVGAAVALVVVIALGLPWWARAIALFIPTCVALISFLEARSSVCVVRAVGGTFENDDRSKVAMDPGALPAIRRVATSITVKSVLLAVPVAVVAALTALLR